MSIYSPLSFPRRAWEREGGINTVNLLNFPKSVYFSFVYYHPDLFNEGDPPMAKKKGARILVKMRSTESAHMYWTEKNRRNDPGRLELRKFDPVLRKHVLFREAK